MPEIAGALPIDERTGWQRVAVWSGGESTGDYTVGEEITAYYEIPGTNWRAEITYYVVASGRDNEGTWRDIMPGEAHDHDDVEYAVDERSEIWYERDGEQTHHEVNYEGGSYLSYQTVEEADAEARRMALIDWSHAFASAAFFENIEPTTNTEEVTR
jgi:hypothetical protein